MPYYNTILSKMWCDIWSHFSLSDTQQSQVMEKHSWNTNEAIISLYNITKNDFSHSFNHTLFFSRCILLRLPDKKCSFFCCSLWVFFGEDDKRAIQWKQFAFSLSSRAIPRHISAAVPQITTGFVAGPFIWQHVLISSIKKHEENKSPSPRYLGRIKFSSCKSHLKCSKLLM